MEQQYSNGTIEITINGDLLRTMEDNDQAVYLTPGASEVYIASEPQFQDDRCVATTQDFLDAMGYDFSDGLSLDDVATVAIEA